jgi:formylglycine-generating enzyme required for sulfatase activity
MMGLLLLWCLAFSDLPAREGAKPAPAQEARKPVPDGEDRRRFFLDPYETAAVALTVQRLGAPTWQEREEAFFLLQRLGRRALPVLTLLKDQVDFQARVKLEYLLKNVPVTQELCPVPGGVVEVGSDDPYCKNPLRITSLQPYAMDRYEVTNFMYYEFVKQTGHTPPEDWRNGRYEPGRENFPVTRVSFRDAGAFARWAGKRIPSADEWEYAARGEKKQYYPWGDHEFRGAANIDNRRTFRKTRVGSFKNDRSSFGCVDMAGNVSEWVVVGPEGGLGVSASKGSAYSKSWRFAMICYKALPKSPSQKRDDLGFRCAR